MQDFLIPGKNGRCLYYLLLISPIFGSLVVYGTLRGIELSGAIANVRDLAPLVAGLLGGPITGTLVGLIGGIHRYILGGSLSTYKKMTAAGQLLRTDWNSRLFWAMICPSLTSSGQKQNILSWSMASE